MKSVTILLPCLNEEKTLGNCLKEIKKYIRTLHYKFKILVCDNNSTDKSQEICKKYRVKYVIEEKKGYGNTLINGINNCQTDYAIMLDCDMSYDITNIKEMLEYLDQGYELIVGNRGKGIIDRGANPLSHKIGNKIISGIGNMLFHTKIKDYNCGIRAFKLEKIKQLNLECPGMEFASEMIIKAKINKLKMIDTPANLRKDGRDGKGYLRVFRDGFRHIGTIIRKKFENSILFRYVSTFLLVMLILFTSLFLSCLIPNKLVHNNLIKSINYYYYDYLFKGKGEIDYYDDYYVIDEGEIRYYEQAYFINPNKPIKSLIEMNCHVYGNISKGDIYPGQEYARYWHGPVLIIRLLSIFFTYKGIDIFFSIIFILLILILLRKLWSESKILSISFLLTCIGFTFYVLPISVEYMIVPIISMIGSILIIKMYHRNSKNLDILLLIMGILSAFFDFLTIETLSITLPLFIYIFLCIRDNKKIKFSKFALYCFLWIVGYALTFGAKWLLDIIHYGKPFIANISYHAGIRFYDVREQKTFAIAMREVFDYIYPFFNKYIKYFLIGIFTFNTVFLVDKKKNIYLFLICLIPIVRFMILYTHSILVIAFTYRSFFPTLLFMIYIFIYEVILIIKNIKYRYF